MVKQTNPPIPSEKVKLAGNKSIQRKIPKTDLQIEITHDILAKKIYARIDADEKMRLKIIQFLKDRYDYHLETAELLSKRELAYIYPYLKQIELSESQASFIKRSRIVAKAKENKRIIIGAGIGIILLAAATLSIVFMFKAKRTEAVAVQAKIEAEIANKHAQEALHKLQDATESIVEAVLDDAKQDIYKLRYQEAELKYLDAYELGKLPMEVSKGLMELIFFHTETGNKEKALILADSIVNIGIHPGADQELENAHHEGVNFRESIHKYLTLIDSSWFKTLYTRYYPVMIPVQGGIFEMGRAKKEDIGEERTTTFDEKPLHKVNISDYTLAQTEVSIWQYNIYCVAQGLDSIARIKKKLSWSVDGDNPVVLVNWFESARYANWLSNQMGLDTVYAFNSKGGFDSTLTQSNGYRFPTEAEWEYASAGGKKGFNSDGSRKFYWATTSSKSILGDFAWFNENSIRTHPIAKKEANLLGLYDMTGNVWEWCGDWYDSKYYETLKDSLTINPRGPEKPEKKKGRVTRSGSWFSQKSFTRTASRFERIPSERLNNFGFRVAKNVALPDSTHTK